MKSQTSNYDYSPLDQKVISWLKSNFTASRDNSGSIFRRYEAKTTKLRARDSNLKSSFARDFRYESYLNCASYSLNWPIMIMNMENRKTIEIRAFAYFAQRPFDRKDDSDLQLMEVRNGYPLDRSASITGYATSNNPSDKYFLEHYRGGQNGYIYDIDVKESLQEFLQLSEVNTIMDRSVARYLNNSFGYTPQSAFSNAAAKRIFVCGQGWLYVLLRRMGLNAVCVFNNLNKGRINSLVREAKNCGRSIVLIENNEGWINEDIHVEKQFESVCERAEVKFKTMDKMELKSILDNTDHKWQRYLYD